VACPCQWEERCGGTRRLDCLGCGEIDAPCSCPCGGWKTCTACQDCYLLEDLIDDRFDHGGD
jgi:hypothetical protein